MNGITKRCIPFAQGTKDPLERVNYEFGLVLGVDEFVDEQCYFLEKEYQHNRALHGYGTVSGLRVTAAENGEDIEVRVAPGIGIDQYGRVFVVRQTQCASLLTWLDEEGVEPGEQTLYVVARYAECETALVPIAGQPCSSSEQLNAPSRLRDIFEIELTLEPPPQAAHQAAINLAAFLNRFRRDPEAGDLSGLDTPEQLAAIIGPDFITRSPADYRTHLNTVAEDLTGEAGARLIPIRPAVAEALLDDILTYWLTAVRPALRPDLIDPDAPENSEAEPPPAEVLLAQIAVTVPEDGVPALDAIVVDNTIRPYLLHTQLIQELYQFPERAGEGGATAAEPVRTFATIEDVSPRVLSLWVHIAHNLELVPNENISLIRIEADGTRNDLTFEIEEDTNRRSPLGRFFRLRTFVTMNDGDFLVFGFVTDQIQVDAAGERQTLSAFIEQAPFTYENLDPDRNRLLTYHVVERGQTIDEDQIRRLIVELLPPQQPVIPFVTITPLTQSDGEFDFLRGYELWFHLDGLVAQNEGVIENLTEENLFLFAEVAPGAVDQVPIALDPIRPNVWRVIPRIDTQRGLPFARFAFLMDASLGIGAYNPRPDANGNPIGLTGFETLRAYIEETRQQLEGHIMMMEEIGEEVLVVYVREQGRAREVEE